MPEKDVAVLFLQAVELRDEGRRAAFEIADLLAKDRAVLVKEDEGGVPAGAEFFLEIVILILDFLRELPALRKINQHEDKVFVRVILEFSGVKDLLVHADAPRAPVGAGEIEKKFFVFRLRLFGGLVEIGQPAGLLRPCAHEAQEKQSNDPRE